MCLVFTRRRKSGVTRMATFKVPNPIFKIPIPIISPGPHDGSQQVDNHVCPVKSIGTDTSRDGTPDSCECPRKHHSQNEESWKVPGILNAKISNGIQDQLKRIYDEARGSEEKLTRKGFIRFLETTQGEEVHVAPTQEEYTLEEFKAQWALNHDWNALRRLRPDEMDYSKPISNYFISSSHNTYLDGHQLTSNSRSKLYRKVLERHCRCIEIDVWNGNTSAKLTPSRSRSPMPAHKRHHSSSSLQGLRKLISGTRQPGLHSRQASAAEPVLTPSLSERESSHTLNPPELDDRLGRSRARSKSSVNRNEPIVLHATWNPKISLTSPVGFREVCQAIGESAFSKDNHLPIIISLEVHADLEQQEVMVDIMKEEWGDKLLDKPLDHCDPKRQQPRLDELLDKILIKVKRPPAKASVPVDKSGLPLAPVSSAHVLGTSQDVENDNNKTGEKPKELKVPICDSLAALAIYTHSESWNQSFSHASARTPSHIFSIEENEILKLYDKRPKDVMAHNRRYFMRAYPNPSKHADSSNMDPSLYWRKGVQMVAMNWQDNKYAEMALNDAMFTPETKGWVLKPQGYRSDDVSFEAEYHSLDLKITVYAGQHIPLPEAMQMRAKPGDVSVGVGASNKDLRPVVHVELIVGREDDNRKFVQKTPTAATDDPNWAPDGDGSVLAFDLPRAVEELSFVRFKIKDDQDYRGQVAAWACIRLDRLKQGYRFVDLTDCKGNQSRQGKLFIKVEKRVR